MSTSPGNSKDRDERVSMHGADPEAVLGALLQVDPDDEPVDDEADGGEHGPRQAWGATGPDAGGQD